jgi:hypothetical protein
VPIRITEQQVIGITVGTAAERMTEQQGLSFDINANANALITEQQVISRDVNANTNAYITEQHFIVEHSDRCVTVLRMTEQQMLVISPR